MSEISNIMVYILEVIPWVGGAIGGWFLSTVGNRRSQLKYEVNHQRMGLTADDAIHGRVEVTYRGNVVSNLYLTSVTVYPVSDHETDLMFC